MNPIAPIIEWPAKVKPAVTDYPVSTMPLNTILVVKLITKYKGETKDRV